MVVISKSILGLSALLAGAVVGVDIIDTPLVAAPGKKIEARHPAFESGSSARVQPASLTDRAGFGDATLVSDGVGTGKGDRLAANCAARAWPYVGEECMAGAQTAAGATEKHRSVRVIAIEERVGANVSVLLKIPSEKVANN